MIPEQFDYEYFWLSCVFEVYAIRIPQVSCKTISNKTADTVVCHFSLLYPSFKEDHQVIQNYIRDVINYFKKGFSSTVVRQIPRYTEFQMTNTTAMGEKRGEKTKNW